MDIFTRIGEWLKSGLAESCAYRITNLFTAWNEQVAKIAENVSQTPQEWNAEIYNMVQVLSETLIMPIACVILTFIVTYDLLSMVMEKNNMKDFDIAMLFKWMLKTAIAVVLVSNTFEIIMAIFEVSQYVIDSSVDIIIKGSTDIKMTIENLEEQLVAMGFFDLIGLWIGTFVIQACIWVMVIIINLIVYYRMISIYIMISLAPIPIACITSREYGSIGVNFIKSLCAVGLQGFLIMICLSMYSVMIAALPTTDNIWLAMLGTVFLAVALCVALTKTNSLAKMMLGAS